MLPKIILKHGIKVYYTTESMCMDERFFCKKKINCYKEEILCYAGGGIFITFGEVMVPECPPTFI